MGSGLEHRIVYVNRKPVEKADNRRGGSEAQWKKKHKKAQKIIREENRGGGKEGK